MSKEQLKKHQRLEYHKVFKTGNKSRSNKPGKRPSRKVK